MNKSRCNLFDWWMLDGFHLSNVKLFRIPITQPHYSPVKCRVYQEFKALAGWFSVNRRGERKFRVTGGAETRVSRVKANVRDTLAAKCACVCLCICVFGYSTAITDLLFILKCQSPTAALCSYLFYHFISLLSWLYIFLPPPITLTDRGLKKRWRCSGTQECLRNRKSPRLKSQTTPSSSQVYTRLLAYH